MSDPNRNSELVICRDARGSQVRRLPATDITLLVKYTKVEVSLSRIGREKVFCGHRRSKVIKNERVVVK